MSGEAGRRKDTELTKEEFIPKWIAWEVTGRCNLNCIHCRASSGMTSHDTDFTTEEAKALLDDIAEVSTPVMVLSGGEPLLRKDLFEIAKYGTGKGSGCASRRTARSSRTTSWER
jgi:MoaA/NifB/PqqE/SkfB family radical SAM enzyme